MSKDISTLNHTLNSPIYKKLPAALILVLTGVYVAACFTPLRVNYDTIRYFALMETMDGTWPAAFQGDRDFLPYGYPAFLWALQKLHILSPFTIGLFQLGYLLGSLWFVRQIFPSSLKTSHLVLFTLLNWLSLRFVVTPLSEMQFVFFSTGAICFFQRFVSGHQIKHLLLLLLFTGLAVVTRTAGLLLVAALIVSYLLQYRAPLSRWIQQKKLYATLILATVLAILALAAQQLNAGLYAKYIYNNVLQNTELFFTKYLLQHFVDWASVFINVPSGKVKQFMPEVWVSTLYIMAGSFFLVLIVYRLCSKKFTIPLVVRVYLAAYLLLIFNWPYFEPRFWMPVLPLLITVLLLPKNGKAGKVYQIMAPLIKVGYAMAGVFAIGYYLHIAFDKKAFADKHDAGIWQKEYYWHFFGENIPRKKQTYKDPVMYEKATYLLQKYD